MLDESDEAVRMNRPISKTWVTIGALSALCCLPVLPVYLWTAGRLSGKVTAGIVGAWLVVLALIGATAGDPEPVERDQPRRLVDVSPSPTPSPEVTPSPTAAVPVVTSRPAPTPKPAPARTRKPQPAPPRTTAPASVYYANCDAVRAAGAAPIHEGEPGYSTSLDRDRDGIACDV